MGYRTAGEVLRDADLAMYKAKADGKGRLALFDTSQENVEIVRTVISLARSLNKRVVAEGIETHEQLEQLVALGAHAGQGYLLSPPLSASHAADRLMKPVAQLG